MNRIQSEAKLTSEFASHLIAARSIPDAMTACQQWATQKFEMMVDDGKRLFDDTQKFMQTGAAFLSGWASKS